MFFVVVAVIEKQRAKPAEAETDNSEQLESKDQQGFLF